MDTLQTRKIEKRNRVTQRDREIRNRVTERESEREEER